MILVFTLLNSFIKMYVGGRGILVNWNLILFIFSSNVRLYIFFFSIKLIIMFGFLNRFIYFIVKIINMFCFVCFLINKFMIIHVLSFWNLNSFFLHISALLFLFSFFLYF